MKDFRDLQVWQKGHRLTLDVYQTTNSFPDRERYGLTNQRRRSAASIAANLAEGCGRGSDTELKRFAQIAMGSASETEYHLLLAHDLGLIGEESHQRLAEQTQEVNRKLSSFIAKLSTSC
jgi:four helix bundle protein